MDIPANLPPNSRLITKREIALGILSKPTYRDLEVKRYLLNDEIVSFTIYHQNNDFNAEFIINNDERWRIWLSQLNNYFIPAEDKVIYQGSITLKNGEDGLGGMDLPKFIDIVKGRKFKAIVNGGLYAIDRIEAIRHGFENVADVVRYIWKELDAERYENVKGLTKSAFCYSLEEV